MALEIVVSSKFSPIYAWSRLSNLKWDFLYKSREMQQSWTQNPISTIDKDNVLSPRPHLELSRRARSVRRTNSGTHYVRLTVESQDPVHRLIPSLLTPRQLTRFSWPFRFPTRSPRNTSQTLMKIFSILQIRFERVNVPCTRNHHTQRTADVQIQRMRLMLYHTESDRWHMY